MEGDPTMELVATVTSRGGLLKGESRMIWQRQNQVRDGIRMVDSDLLCHLEGVFLGHAKALMKDGRKAHLVLFFRHVLINKVKQNVEAINHVYFIRYSSTYIRV